MLVCWSKLGKQCAVGLKNGKIVRVNPVSKRSHCVVKYMYCVIGDTGQGGHTMSSCVQRRA